MALINGVPGDIGTSGDDDIVAFAADSGSVIQGLDGNDSMSAEGDNITLDGGLGADILSSSGNNNTLIGGPGFDMLIGDSGTNTTASYANAAAGVTVDLSSHFAADDGDGSYDYLSGIQNVTGSAFADTLTGDGLANVLKGGAGNDALTGGAGADIFNYSFDLTQGSGGGSTTTYKFTDWLSDKYDGKDFGDHLPDYVPSDGHKGGKDDKDHQAKDHHNNNGKDDGHHQDGDGQSANTGLTQDFFSTNYTAWLKDVVVTDLLAQGLVQDVNGNGKIDIKLNQNDPYGTPFIEGLSAEMLASMFSDRDGVVLKTGEHGQERFYSNQFTSTSGGGTTTTLTSGDGFDTINDFALGADHLQFNVQSNGLPVGLTLGEFDSFFDVTSNGVDTTLALADGTWGVTLVGVSGTVADFYGASLFS